VCVCECVWDIHTVICMCVLIIYIYMLRICLYVCTLRAVWQPKPPYVHHRYPQTDSIHSNKSCWALHALISARSLATSLSRSWYLQNQKAFYFASVLFWLPTFWWNLAFQMKFKLQQVQNSATRALDLTLLQCALLDLDLLIQGG